ncbi:UNVERIFIED_CONTAM: hypothetical protein Sindi_0493400 [Sesamum indicum]
MERQSDEREHANNVSEENGEVFVVCEVNSVLSINKHEWLLDFGCTFHMSPFKETFSNFKNESYGFVPMANENRSEIMDFGDIALNFKDGYKLILKNVRYVPDLSHNLISCAALEEEVLEGRWGKQHGVHFPAKPSQIPPCHPIFLTMFMLMFGVPLRNPPMVGTTTMFRVCQCSGETVVSEYYGSDSSAMDDWMRLKLDNYDVKVVGYATVQERRDLDCSSLGTKENVLKPIIRRACSGELQPALPGPSKAGSRQLKGMLRVPERHENLMGSVGPGWPTLGANTTERLRVTRKVAPRAVGDQGQHLWCEWVIEARTPRRCDPIHMARDIDF